MTRPNSAPEPGKTRWAYAYEIVPAQPDDLLRSIEALLDGEHADAIEGARTWGSRIVVEPGVTNILVVSDTPRQDLEINRRLEAALRKLGAEFSVTAPLAVDE